MNRINMNISNMHKNSVSGLNTELSALRHGSRRGQRRRNNFYLCLSFCTGPLRSRMGSRCPCISEAYLTQSGCDPCGIWRPQPARWSLRDCRTTCGGADWRPPHLCGRVLASCEVLLAGLCRPCRLAGCDSSQCRKPSNNGWLRPGARGTPTETSPECSGMLAVADLRTDL